MWVSAKNGPRQFFRLKMQLDVGSEPTLRLAYVTCNTQDTSKFWKSLDNVHDFRLKWDIFRTAAANESPGSRKQCIWAHRANWTGVLKKTRTIWAFSSRQSHGSLSGAKVAPLFLCVYTPAYLRTNKQKIVFWVSISPMQGQNHGQTYPSNLPTFYFSGTI